MNDLKIYLSTPPETAKDALKLGPVSIMAYRVGRNFQLKRLGFPPVRYDIMDVDMSDFTGYGPHEALAAQITRECRHMGYGGVSLGLGRPTPQLTAFAQRLAEAADGAGLRLYLPPGYASIKGPVTLLLPAQNLSGTYDAYIRHIVDLYGPGGAALEFERVCTDFPLPARSGRGTVLTERETAKLRGQAFYSPELTANYLTYISSMRAHLVMWDDLETLKAKMETARALGIREGFFYYPHVADIAGELTEFGRS